MKPLSFSVILVFSLCSALCSTEEDTPSEQFFIENNNLIRIVNNTDTFNLNDVIPEEDEEGNISTDEKFVLRYFIKYIHTIPVYIKEINIDTYNSVKNNPLYQTVVLNCNVTGGFRKGGTFNIDEVEQADKKMPGIKLYLQEETF